MMDIFDVIHGRTSYRGRYKDILVPREDLRKILEAGIAAPSGCNKQTASFIAVDDRKLLDGIKALIDPPIAETAPAFILVLTQRIYAYRDKCFNIQDYSAAIENMLLAAKALGYESCWYEGHITDDDDIAGRIAAYMGIPDGYRLVCILPVGIPEDEIHHTPKKPFESRAWFNSGSARPTAISLIFACETSCLRLGHFDLSTDFALRAVRPAAISLIFACVSAAFAAR